MLKRSLLLAALLVVLLGIAGWDRNSPAETRTPGKSPSCADSHVQGNRKEHPSDAHLLEPADHFYLMRSYPETSMDLAAYDLAMNQALASQRTNKTTGTTGIQDSPWLLEGPTNTGGRINALAIDPNDPNTILQGSAAGGIFKTTDAGITWLPVFDGQSHLAIGDIVYAPGSSQIVYVGTGDPNIGGYPFIGNGIYKSTDGGNTWNHLGLDNTRTTGRIVIDPNNTNVVYVATMGLPMNRDNHRGLYKSTDGGTTWTQSLFVTDQAGVVDVVMDPNNSQVLYASSWDRIRTNQESLISGPNAKVWKTTNAGGTWTALGGGLPTMDMSRVNLAIHPTNGNIVYAAYVGPSLMLNNIYKTTNAGTSWSAVDISTLDPDALGGFGWYFANIFLNPYDPNQLYLMGMDLWRTTDNGTTWASADPNYYTHADKHDMAFLSASSYYIGTDGGLYRTGNNGFNYVDADNVPNSQIYRLAVNSHIPGKYAAGFQDNGTEVGGASAVNNWMSVYGADGFQPLYDNDPQHMVAEIQNGWLTYSLDAGNSWWDFITGIDFNDRRNWDMPVILSAHNNDTYYTGTYRLYRNTTGLVSHSWVPISGDLTDGIVFAPRFHNITTIAESPLSSQILYVGTSDGNVHRSTNGGITWGNVSAGLPERYMTSVKASPHATDDVYVTTSGYKSNDYLPHVFRSTDNGTNWTDISGDLPALALNDILVHPTDPDILVVASDGGVYATQNGGINWVRVGSDLPVCPVYDMEWDIAGGKLVVGTHARSMWSFPMDSLETGVVVDLPEPGADGGFQVYPNPVRDVLHTGAGDSPWTRWEVMDANGRVLRRGLFPGNDAAIRVDDLAHGVYFLRAFGGNGPTVRRFVKE
jgi:photosystem II stability/assembly factor-like uncharacterized protein